VSSAPVSVDPSRDKGTDGVGPKTQRLREVEGKSEQGICEGVRRGSGSLTHSCTFFVSAL
jgi:hypothetical protein